MHPNGLLLFGHFSPHVSWYVIAHDSSSNQRKVNLIFCLSDDVIDDEVVVNLKGSGKGKQQKKWEQQFKGAHSMQNDNTRLFNLKHWRLLVWRFFGTDNQ